MSKPAKTPTIRPISLSILGASEDVPRLISGFGKAWGGDAVLVLRPRDNAGLLLHQVKKQAPRAWRTDLGLAPSHEPELDITAEAAVAEMKKAKGSPPPAGPATLKGSWAGQLHVNEFGVPHVELQRKIAAYGWLRLTSKPDGRWIAIFDRATKWFGQAKSEQVERSSLAEAITAGMGLVIGLVSEACSFRDTHRRNTVDPEYAVRFPPPAEREVKDRTERFKPKATYTVVQAADAWTVVNAVGGVVATFGKREKAKAQKHATALSKGGTPATAAPVAIPSLSELPSPKVPTGAQTTANVAEGIAAEAHAIEVMAGSLWGSSEAPEVLARAGKLIKHAQSLIRSPLCAGKERTMAVEDVKRAADAYEQAHAALSRGEKADIVATLRRIAERVALAAARAGKSCSSGQQKITRAPRSADDVAKAVSARETPEWSVGDVVYHEDLEWTISKLGADPRFVTPSRPVPRDALTIERPGPPKGPRGGKNFKVVRQSEVSRTPSALAIARGSHTIGQPDPNEPPVKYPSTVFGVSDAPTVTMQPVWPPAAPPQRVRTTRTQEPKAPKAPRTDPAKDKLLVDAFASAIAAAAASMRQGTRESLPAAKPYRIVTKKAPAGRQGPTLYSAVLPDGSELVGPMLSRSLVQKTADAKLNGTYRELTEDESAARSAARQTRSKREPMPVVASKDATKLNLAMKVWSLKGKDYRSTSDDPHHPAILWLYPTGATGIKPLMEFSVAELQAMVAKHGSAAREPAPTKPAAKRRSRSTRETCPAP